MEYSRYIQIPIMKGRIEQCNVTFAIWCFALMSIVINKAGTAQSIVTFAIGYYAYVQLFIKNGGTEQIVIVCFEATADKNHAGQTEELMLLQEYLAKGQKLLVISIHNKININEKISYTKELTDIASRRLDSFIMMLRNFKQYAEKVKGKECVYDAFRRVGHGYNVNERHWRTEAFERSQNMLIRCIYLYFDDYFATNSCYHQLYMQRDCRIRQLEGLNSLQSVIIDDKTIAAAYEKTVEILHNVIDEEKYYPCKQITVKRVAELVKNAASEKRSICGSVVIKLYRNVIINETYRMMMSIDMVVAEAKHLFGLERSWIFFDLLDNELFNFGSAGAISNFVPNMAESAVRQHVISFFEHVCEMMNRLMALFLGCPDSKQLQQMPEERFISILQSVIISSLKSKTKEGKGLSSEGATEMRLIMVDSQEFQRALGEEVPEDVLGRLSHGDEMVVHRFVDTRLERTQASERIENRPIHSIYFPSDCRLFIYIPTENGSYWHQLDVLRANRIHLRIHNVSCNYNHMSIKCKEKYFRKDSSR